MKNNESINKDKSKSDINLENLYEEFANLIKFEEVDFEYDDKFSKECSRMIDYIAKNKIKSSNDREKEFFAYINRKFNINSENFARLYELCAINGVTFNYHQKISIQYAFDTNDLCNLSNLLLSFGGDEILISRLLQSITCSSKENTLTLLHDELREPKKLRIPTEGDKIKLDIMKSLFASFLHTFLDKKEMHMFFDNHYNEHEYYEDFWLEIQNRFPRLFRRDEAVHFLIIDQNFIDRCIDYNEARNTILEQVKNSYYRINNHGFLIVMVKNLNYESRDISWEISADIVLFGEKHLEKPLDKKYFRHKIIQEETMRHIPEIKTNEAQFDVASDGFTYKDCFIVKGLKDKEINQLLILQKNFRDETILPCPSCRSSNVEGNSYSSLGVKSWECQNPLCPDRSKYNRGNRYSFKALSMQRALEDLSNEIPMAFVKVWRRDIVDVQNYNDIIELIVRHYSIRGDRIRCFGDFPNMPNEFLGRNLLWEGIDIKKGNDNLSWFDQGLFFKRYGFVRSQNNQSLQKNLGNDDFRIICDDSRNALSTIEEMSIDGAVTSPPYYNAKEYSQWSNIYCYLQEMMDINCQVYRVLKPGSLYFYNIFDYFDNENIMALSAMGNKRLILSAYTIDLFRRIGFECIGNIVWDKGEIEGKRGFNAGNFSPFYQAPFNCWEHVLVFRKPGGNSLDFGGSRIEQIKPVFKMVQGKNTHGHTAPFPDGIPLLCIKILPQNSTVLDPFGGSLTTGRVAAQIGIKSICIEKNWNFCEIGLEMYNQLVFGRQEMLAF